MKITKNTIACFKALPAAVFVPARTILIAWVMALALTALLVPAAWAQTAFVTPITLNYWAGINTSNALSTGSNIVTFASADGSTNNLTVTGQPSGLTTLLSTNLATNTLPFALFLYPTNATPGYTPLTITSSGGSYAAYSTNVNLFVVPQWRQTNTGTIGNWSDATKWSGAAIPSIAGSDSVYFESTIDVPYTNVVDSSNTVQSLVYIGDQGGGSTADIATIITNGAVLSVVGTNGLYFGVKTTPAKRPVFLFAGGGALVVNNTNANVAANSGSAPSSANGPYINMTNLNTFSATVNQFGAGAGMLNTAGLLGGEEVNFWLAKTNTITTSFVDNYANLSFNCAFEFGCNQNYGSGSVNPTFYLGLTNGFYVDSVLVGRAQGSSGVSLTGGGYTLKFNPLLINSVSPAATAYWRGMAGGNNRISLIAVGADSGPTNTALSDTKGSIDLRGGNVDVVVDQIWLGHNRTNAIAKTAAGAFLFDWGNVNANTVIVGYQQYANLATVAGYLSVGTNGTLNVNSNLVLGQNPATVGGFTAQAAITTGQLQINNGGTVRAKQITVGQYSTNAIIINAGGTLDVTNNIASSGTMLSTLTANGGALTLHVNGGNTLVYVSNIIASASSAINIASISGLAGFPGTIHSTNLHLVSYVGATSANLWQGGTGPAGVIVGVANNSGNNSIDVSLTAGSAKSLIWKDYTGNHQWDNTSANWLDTVTGLHTNFGTLDKVTFDDSGFGTVNVTETVIPGQSGIGVLVTNNTLNYTFTGVGQILGGSALTKAGTQSLTVDLYAEFGVSLNGGSMAVTSAGTIGSANAAAGTALVNAGTVLASVTCSGNVNNNNIITGALAVQTSGIVTNFGTVGGAVSMQTNSLLNNYGGHLNAIGALVVQTNSTLINSGTIYGSTLNVIGTLIDTAPGSMGASSGSINVGTLTINATGTFLPGGGAIQTTKVTDYDITASQTGNPNGRVQLAAGSMTVLQINTSSSPSNTMVLSQNQGFGPSQSGKAFNGGTLIISNVGPALVAGETFQFFGYYINSGDIKNAGLYTTNAYPIIQPSVPGPGLVWDLSQLIPQGKIGVLSATDPSLFFTLTNHTTVINPSNIVTELSWPASVANGGWIQQLTTTLTNGLTATNWTSPSTGVFTNQYGTTGIIFTNNLIGDPNAQGSATFFRFVYP